MMDSGVQQIPSQMALHPLPRVEAQDEEVILGP